MSNLRSLSAAELAQVSAPLEARYEALQARGLKLDMTRGKPCAEQLDLSNALLDRPKNGYTARDGSDARNYGGLDGLPEMKALLAPLFQVPAAQIIVGGSSSLQMMHDAIVRALIHGVPGGSGPWNRRHIKFLCPSPGYDRHFAICQHFGIEMLPIELGADGPDLERVERLLRSDAEIVGMWCVPKYSNPSGTVYSGAVVAQLARIAAAAPDFRLFWDNAYALHTLHAEDDRLADIIAACREAGHDNRPLVFASTSKISFAGAGVAALASSPDNIADAKRHLAIQTIGPDKLNQLRHVELYRDFAGLVAHMRQQAAILRPKFEAVQQCFARELGGTGLAEWTEPRGGYFVSLNTLDGCAKDVVGLADAAGVKLTAAGATFPYGRDPRDRNIRIAPTFPPLDQIRAAMEVVSVCVLLASVRKLCAEGQN
jgi:DNA-binding transcriptional MocR family regulator